MREGGNGRNGRVRRHLLNTLTHTSIPLWKVPLMEGNEESKLPTLVLLYFILKKKSTLLTKKNLFSVVVVHTAKEELK